MPWYMNTQTVSKVLNHLALKQAQAPLSALHQKLDSVIDTVWFKQQFYRASHQ